MCSNQQPQPVASSGIMTRLHNRMQPIGEPPHKKTRSDETPEAQAGPAKAAPEPPRVPPPLPEPCQAWIKGHGCNVRRCPLLHPSRYDILNLCHRFMRGQRCHGATCYRTHITLDDFNYNMRAASGIVRTEPSSSSSSETLAPYRLRDTVANIINNMPPQEKRAKVLRLLTRFHPDKVQEAQLIQFFKPTTEFLISQL